MALARWQATIVDEHGDVQDGATVTVRRETGGAPLANLFSDRAGVVPTGNPIAADSNGFAYFYVAGGAYRITATKGAFSITWRYVAIGTAGEYDTTDVTALVQQVDAGYALAFESETSAPPSAGSVRFDNADLSAATKAYIDADNLGGSEIVARLLELYDAARTIKDAIIFQDPETNIAASFQVDGATGIGSPVEYVELTISAHSGETSFTDGARLNMQRERAGVDGQDGVDGDVTTTGSPAPAAGEYARFTDAMHIEGRDVADVRSDLGLGALALLDSINSATTAAEGIVELATAAEARAATAGKALTTDLIASAVEPVALADAATVAIDWASGVYFTLTLTANRVLGNPTNEQPGTFRQVLVNSDALSPASAHTLTFGNEYGGDLPTLDDITDDDKYLLTIFCKSAGNFLVTAINGSDA